MGVFVIRVTLFEAYFVYFLREVVVDFGQRCK